MRTGVKKNSKSVLKRCATIKELKKHFDEIQSACSGDTRFCAAASLFIAEKVNELVLETQKANLENGVALLKVLTDFIEKKEIKSNASKNETNVPRVTGSSQGKENAPVESPESVLEVRGQAPSETQG